MQGNEIMIAHSMDVRMTAEDMELGIACDTTIRITVDVTHRYPEAQMVALLWMASNHIFEGIDEFESFRDDFEQNVRDGYQGLIDRWPHIYGSTEKAMKKIFAAPKALMKRPPWSLCPRCRMPVWANEGSVELGETRRLLEKNMTPLWCRTCGQRFVWDGDRLECTSAFSTDETLRTLDSMFPVDQPSFADMTTQIEAATTNGGE